MRIPFGPVRFSIVILAALVLVQGGAAAPGCAPEDAVCGSRVEPAAGQSPISGSPAAGLVTRVAHSALSEATDAAEGAAGNATAEVSRALNGTTNPVPAAVQETVWDVVEPVDDAYRYAVENWPEDVNTPQVQTEYGTVEGGAVDIPVGPTSLPVPSMAPPRTPPAELIDTAMEALIGPRPASAPTESPFYGGGLRAGLGQAPQVNPDAGPSRGDPTQDDASPALDDASPADDAETMAWAVNEGNGWFHGLLIPAIATAMIGALLLAAWLAMRRALPARWLGGIPLAALFSRQSGSAVLLHPIRQAIHSTIQQQPGITPTMLASRIDMEPSTIRYHLLVLQREGQIQARREGKMHHYYADPSLANANWKARACLFMHRRAELAHAILAQPGANQQGIVRKTDIPASRVSSYVQDLISSGLVTSRREGRHCRYFPTNLLQEIGVNGGLIARAMR